MVAAPTTRIDAISTSPATTPSGRAIVIALLAEIPIPAAPWNEIPVDGVSVTTQVNVSVASTVVPSWTVTATGYGLEPAAPEAIYPVTRPLSASIVTPAGRPVAA